MEIMHFCSHMQVLLCLFANCITRTSGFCCIGDGERRCYTKHDLSTSDKTISVVDDFFATEACDVVCTRRRSLAAAALASSSLLVNPNKVFASTNKDSRMETNNAMPKLTIPLHYEPKLSAYIISYTVGRSRFGAIVDTGSPFLVVPQTSCKPDYPWGCYRPEESHEAVGLKPTRERFDGNEGWVEWRQGSFSFLPDSTPVSTSLAANTITNTELDSLFPMSSMMTFGVISESLMDGPGGIFLGLVKYTDSWIRPSFLGQSAVTAFSVDLRKREGISPSLTLYGDTKDLAMDFSPNDYSKYDKSRTDTDDYLSTLKLKGYIPLTKELNTRHGDPTIHYVAIASSIKVNGSTLEHSSRPNGKLYVIFDTGCSGMSVSPDLFDRQYTLARSQKAKNVWDQVELDFKTCNGELITLNAKRPITTPLASDRPWGKKLDGHLIVLGLSFLDNLKMTIDVDNSKVWFDK